MGNSGLMALHDGAVCFEMVPETVQPKISSEYFKSANIQMPTKYYLKLLVFYLLKIPVGLNILFLFIKTIFTTLPVALSRLLTSVNCLQIEFEPRVHYSL